MRASPWLCLLVTGCLDATKGRIGDEAPSDCADVGALKTVATDVESFALGHCGTVAFWQSHGAATGRRLVVLGPDGNERGRVDAPNGYAGQVAMAADGEAVAWWEATSDLGFGVGRVSPLDAVAGDERPMEMGELMLVGDVYAVHASSARGHLTRITIATNDERVLDAEYAALTQAATVIVGDRLTLTGDGELLVVSAECESYQGVPCGDHAWRTRIIDLAADEVVLDAPGWRRPLVARSGRGVVAQTSDGLAWRDEAGAVHEVAGLVPRAVTGSAVIIAERAGKLVAIDTNGETEVAAVAARMFSAGDDGVAFATSDNTVSVWTAAGIESTVAFDGEVTALALLDHAVLVAARGGPGEELWLIARGSDDKTLLRGGHAFDIHVDRTGTAVAIGYIPSSGVFRSLDVGRP